MNPFTYLYKLLVWILTCGFIEDDEISDDETDFTFSRNENLRNPLQKIINLNDELSEADS